MYAIVQTGGKQYRAEVGSILRIEKLDDAVDKKIALPVIMVVADGDVRTKGTVEGVVVSHGKGEKLNIFTYKAKKNQRKRQGHRQPYTEVKITGIK